MGVQPSEARTTSGAAMSTHDAVTSVFNEAKGLSGPTPVKSTDGGFFSGTRTKFATLAAIPMLVLAACGGGDKTPTTPTNLPTDTPRPTSTFEPTASPTVVVESPSTSPSATPAEKTPAPTIKPGTEIINPEPSEKPQSPVTAREMEDAVNAAFTTENLPGLTPNQLTIMRKSAKDCENSSQAYLDRLAECEGLMGYGLKAAKQFSNQLSWDAAFKVYWYTTGANGIGPKAKPPLDAFLKQYYSN